MADTTHKIQATTEALSSLRSGVMGITKSWKAYAEHVHTATEAQMALQDSAYKGADGFTAMAKSLDASGQQFRSMAKIFTDLASNIPLLESKFVIMGKAVEFLGDTFAIAAQKQRLLAEDIGYWDSFSSFTRRLESDMRGLGGAFGEGVDKSRELADSFVKVQTEIKGIDYGFLGGDELKGFTEQLANVNLHTGYLTERIDIAGKSYNLMGASMLQAGYMGLESAGYMKLLGDSIMKQGLTSEDAMESIAGYSVVSRETGLSVDSVSKSMNEAANGFAMLGMSADFGRPLILGYADSLGEMGLGMENAIALSKTLTSTLGDLGTKYDKAFLLQQRGGLDLGAGGGALGAGIGIQAAMLKAEGDPAAQADLSSKLADSLKNTLASFGGGRIVTVSEAAKNPEMQNAFYIQQQLLEKQFGMDSKSSVRTLEMLSQLEDATKRGDTDLAAELEKQIKSETDGRDETLDELKKLNISAAAQLAATLIGMKEDAEIGRDAAGELRGGHGERATGAFNVDYQKGVRNLFQDGIDPINAMIEERMKNINRDGTTFMDQVTDVYGEGAQGSSDRMNRAISDDAMGSEPVKRYEDAAVAANRSGVEIMSTVADNTADIWSTAEHIKNLLTDLAAAMAGVGAPAGSTPGGR